MRCGGEITGPLKRTLQRTLLGVVIFAACTAAQTTRSSADIEQSQISRTELARKSDSAIQRGVKFLLSRQNPDGSWGDGRQTDSEGGNTALVVLALLSCGESHQSPPLDRAIKFLKRAEPQKATHATYSVGLRACVYAQLPEVLRKDELRADLRWLQEHIIERTERRGMYDYGRGVALGGDYSNSQYGVLGVWYAALAGLDVPRAYWKKVEDGWRAGQGEDGGWGYMPGDRGSYASMSAAGAATLFITNDYLHSREAEDLNKVSINKPLDEALRWLGESFAVDRNIGRDNAPGQRGGGIFDGFVKPIGTYVHYMLFGYERVGEASGLTRFGTHKWFDEGADFLIRTQEYDGHWLGTIGSEADTAYSLLFLSRGRAPIVIQKLQFDGRWNNRPRDASGFTHFMRRASERHVNWQVVSIDATPAELRESPMLYIASDRALKLGEQQKTRIKTYIDEGGLLVCVNEGRGDELARSIIALAGELYPAYKFRDLPQDHPVYTANFPVKTPTEPIRGLSNGLRELIVLFPSGDMSWKWQATGGGFLPKSSPYAPLANLLLYVTDRANPRFKGEDTWIERNPGVQATRTARIARLRYDGNWDPEPAGWQRLANSMHNFDQLDLRIEPTSAPEGTVLAHLTATKSVQLPLDAKNAIRRYLDAGGLLLLDAAGGSSEAAGSFEGLLRGLYPDVAIAPLPLDHPLYHAKNLGGQDIDSVSYRRAPDLQAIHVPRLRGATAQGKLIAIVSYEDLSGGLVGYSTGGLIGYTPASAMNLMRNLILWRASGK